MSFITRFYFDILGNIFSYLLASTMVQHTLKIKINKTRRNILFIFLLIYSIPESLPFQNILSFLVIFLIIAVLCYPKLKEAFVIFLKWEFLSYIGQFVIQFVHTLILFDFETTLDNPYYAHCKTLICFSLVYICYILYTNAKRLKQFQTHYHHIFTIVILFISLALSYLTLFICQTQKLNTPIIPILFSALFILIAVFINIYGHFIDLMEENLRAQIMLEHSKMTEDYSKQIETNLKDLHSLRHDIRNHLIIIDGYASQKRYESIHEYITKITHNYTDVPLFDTPSNVVSALLNAKHQAACKQHIDFSIDWDFPYIHIEDFSIITILGNLIDNAITATGKCENGWIILELMQSGSYLEIHIKNNHMEKIQEKNGQFQTSKEEDGHIHGLGIKNIRSTVEQLNGQIDIHYTEELFEVDILVPNY